MVDKKTVKKTKVFQATGKRKTAIAKATLKEGTGMIRINSHRLDTITPYLAKERIREPLILAGEDAKKVNINVKTSGGGWSSQTEATRLAIARTLTNYNKKLKKTFLDYDRHLLVADTRFKETCKPNATKARAKRQKSYR